MTPRLPHPEEATGAMRLRYADPPYLGCGKKLYGDQHEHAADFDSLDAHESLLVRLRDEYPDGWAVSLHTPSLESYLHISRRIVGENRVRVGAWVKPFASFKPNVNPAYCWEPVIFFGGRSALARGGKDAATVRDYVSENITLQRGMPGAKPDAFCRWIFDILCAESGDELVDIFPGSGAVGRAWSAWTSQVRIFA